MDSPLSGKPLTPIGKQIAEREQDEQVKKLREESVRNEYADKYRKTCDVIADPKFQWFLDNVLQPRVQQELENAINVGRSKDDRADSCQRHDFGVEILNLAIVQKKFYADKAGITSTT